MVSSEVTQKPTPWKAGAGIIQPVKKTLQF